LDEVMSMRAVITSLGEVVGLAGVAVGFGMAWLPLGVVAGGVGLFAICYKLGGDL
jgi:hypothetical protein